MLGSVIPQWRPAYPQIIGPWHNNMFFLNHPNRSTFFCSVFPHTIAMWYLQPFLKQWYWPFIISMNVNHLFLALGLYLYWRDAAFPELGHNSRHLNGKRWEPILIFWVTGNSSDKLYQLAVVELDAVLEMCEWTDSSGGADNCCPDWGWVIRRWWKQTEGSLFSDVYFGI